MGIFATIEHQTEKFIASQEGHILRNYLCFAMKQGKKLTKWGLPAVVFGNLCFSTLKKKIEI